MEPHVYVICRKDLDPIYASVQGGHALADLLMNHKLEKWNNDYLIYLSVKGEFQLNKLIDKLEERGITYGKFLEPDLDGQLTAIAIEGHGELFLNLDLLS